MASDIPRALRLLGAPQSSSWRRTLTPGGRVLVVAEFYAHGPFADLNRAVMAMLGGRAWTEEQHRHWFASTGLADVEVRTEPNRGWIAVMGRRSSDEGQPSDP